MLHELAESRSRRPHEKGGGLSLRVHGATRSYFSPSRCLYRLRFAFGPIK
jgi:hypothetical protein